MVSQKASRPARQDDVVALTSETWHLFEELFGPGGLQGGCWCAFFRMAARDFDQSTPAEHKQYVRTTVCQGHPFGLLAVVDGRAQGWIAVGPRLANVRLAKSTVARVPANDDLHTIWSVTCFYIRRGARGSGLTDTLLGSAVRYAKEHGAGIIEGYPVVKRGAHLSASDLYHGELRTFLNAGFQCVEKRGVRRALVRLVLTKD